MGTAANVLVGATGKVYGAPTATALPTTPSATPNVAFGDLGYIDENGVTQAIAADQTSIKAWGGDEVRKLQTSHSLTYKFAFMETNPDVLEAYYGNHTSGTVEITAEEGLRQAWIIDVLDGTSIVRIVIPDGQITARDDVVYKTDTAIVYGVELSCFPDSSDVKAYMYVLDNAVS